MAKSDQQKETGMKTIIGLALAFGLGAFTGRYFLGAPQRRFSVDAQGGQHCSGLRQGESFEVFCRSVERPLGESAPHLLDRTLHPRGQRHPAAESYRAPWAPRPPSLARRPATPGGPGDVNPDGRPYAP
jgi:hypothetical protein